MKQCDAPELKSDKIGIKWIKNLDATTSLDASTVKLHGLLQFFFLSELGYMLVAGEEVEFLR